MSWGFDRSNRFRRGYKNASSELQKRIDEALTALASAEDPNALGKPKQGPWKRHRAYEFGTFCRMLYEVEYETRIINLDRVCSHKEYGP